MDLASRRFLWCDHESVMLTMFADCGFLFLRVIRTLAHKKESDQND